MPVDINARRSKRAQFLIKLAGVIDPMTGSYQPTQPPHKQFIISTSSQAALNTHDMTMILSACYKADLWSHIDKSQRGQYPAPALCPRGAIYMVSRESGRYRNSTAGRIMKLDVYQAAIVMEEDAYEPATEAQILESVRARAQHYEDLKIRESELHPEKAKPTVIIQAPDYSRMGMGNTIPEGYMLVRTEDQVRMINEAVDARIKHLSQGMNGAESKTNDAAESNGIGTGTETANSSTAEQAHARIHVNQSAGIVSDPLVVPDIPVVADADNPSSMYTVNVGEAQELTPEERRRQVRENLEKAKRLRT